MINLSEIEAAAKAATPGPRMWVGNHRGNVELRTCSNGQLIVMDFVRQGMQAAQPRFGCSVDGGNRGNKGGIMFSAEEIIKRNGKLNHPDAAILELLDRETILAMVEAIRAMPAALEALNMWEGSAGGKLWLWPETAHASAMNNTREAAAALRAALQPFEPPQ